MLACIAAADLCADAAWGAVTLSHAPAEGEQASSDGAHVLQSGLTIEAHPAAPVLGIDREITLFVRPPAGSSWPRRRPRVLEVQASAGDIEDVLPNGDDGWRVRLVLPLRRAPQGIIVHAHAAVRNHTVWAALFLPLPAVAAPAFHADPGAEVSMIVGGKSFGPKRANAAGDVRVPIVVAPGTAIAMAHSINRDGQTAQEALDLGLPSFRRSLLWAPKSAVHGTPAEAWLFAMDERARPACSAAFVLFAGSRRAEPLENGCGWTRYLAPAPLLSQRQDLQLAAYARDEQLAAPLVPPADEPAARVAVPLVAGPARRLILLPNRSALAVGSGQRMMVVVRAEDAFGHAADAETARVYVDGVAATDVRKDAGRLMVVVRAPRRATYGKPLVIEAIASAEVHARLDVPLDQPADAFVRRSAPPPEHPWAIIARGGPVMSPDIGHGPGLGVEAQRQWLEWERWPRGLFITGAINYVMHAEKLIVDAGITRLRTHAVPMLVGAAWRLRPRPNVALYLALAGGAARFTAAHDSYGVTVSGAGWTTATRFSAEAVLGSDPFQLAVGGSFLDVPGASLSSQDRLRGSLGGFGMHIGVRRQW